MTSLPAHRWNTLKTYEAILNELGADIICFQGARRARVAYLPALHLQAHTDRLVAPVIAFASAETKITKKQVERSMAILPSWDSFFSSYSRKPERGYSGTCIFTRREAVVPLKAEEGISGLLPLERGKGEAGSSDQLIGGTLSPESIALDMSDVRTIDSEGRTTIVDLGLFVLINLYCPNETNEERLDFKLAFNAMLEARILNLIRAGREVVILGDLNICAKAIDHCDPVRRAGDHPAYGAFENHPARKWFNAFVDAPERGGTMVDLARHFHPDRRGMYTHWETRINARETNYGTRIDYILATPGLLPWIKDCEVQQHILGSDHCPVVVDFHEEITQEDGSTLRLWDMVNVPGRSRMKDAPAPEPPRLAAKFYSEFSTEQRLLSNFFGKKGLQPESGGSGAPAKSSSQKVAKTAAFAGQPGTSAMAPAPVPGQVAVSTSISESAVDALGLASTSAASTSQGLEMAGTPVSLLPPPLPSPSIDLTLADSNGEGEGDLQSKSKPSSTALRNGASRSKSVASQTARAESSRSPSVTAPTGSAATSAKRAKKGQASISTFFKPPRPPTPPPVAAKSKGKGKRKKRSTSDPDGQLGPTSAADAASSSGSKGKGKVRAIDLDDEDEGILAGDSGDDSRARPSSSQVVDDEDGDDEEGLEQLRKRALNGGKEERSAQKRKKKKHDTDGSDSDEIRQVRECRAFFFFV